MWLVIRVVEDHLDTSVFHAARRAGGAGTAEYDLDMVVMLLVWAYANGVASSRIEAACWSDVSFRVICVGNAPDHVTIARFRAAFPGAVESLFAGVLVLCAKLGMGKLGAIALDGTKVAANASQAANRTEETLRKLAAGAAAEAVKADAVKDELFGAGRRGDEVPPEAVNPATRAGRIAAALAELEAERQAAARAGAAGGGVLGAGGAPGAPPAEIAVAAARAKLERAALSGQRRWPTWKAGGRAAGARQPAGPSQGRDRGTTAWSRPPAPPISPPRRAPPAPARTATAATTAAARSA